MATIIENNGDAGSTPENTSYSIALGDVFQGTLETVDDRDLIQIELSAETIYDIRLHSDAAPAKLNDHEKLFQVVLYDSDGDRVVSGVGIAYGSLLIHQPPVTGTYYLKVHSPFKGVSGDYEVSVVENTIPVGTYDEIAAYLTDGFWEWRGVVGSGAAFDVVPGGVLTADITALSEEVQELSRWALEAWTNVTGIKFEFVDDENANIVFDNEDADYPTGGFTSVSDRVIISSRVNMPARFPPDEDDISGFMSVFIHEIGHALGLGHPGPYPSFNEEIVTVFGFENLFLLDAEQRTIMSYVYDNTYINASRTTAVTPMIVDIIAIQNLYGVPTDINSGDTVYGYRSNLDGYLGYVSTLLAGDSKNPFIGIGGNASSHPELADLDGDGDLDIIVGKNHLNSDETQYVDYTVDYYENTGSITDPVFTQRTGEDNPLENAKTFVNYKPVLADLDGDGDFDFIVGTLYYYENTGSVTDPEFTQRTGTDSPLHGISTQNLGIVILPDLDQDGDLDLVAVNNDGDVLYFNNTGTAMDPEFTQRTGATNPLEEIEADDFGRGSPTFIDLDNDGDLDLTVGRIEGVFDYYENTGAANNPEFTLRTDADSPFSDIKPVYQANPVLSDLDGDGDLDLISGDVWGNVYYFENTGTATTPDFVDIIRGGQPISMTLYDNGGVDTLDLRTDRNDQMVDLRPEGISNVYGLSGNLIIARDTVIENYIGGFGDDTVTANDADNILEGRAGGDTLDGAAGNDTAAYTGSDASVTVNLSDGTATGGHAEGDTLNNIENLSGSAFDDTLTGDAADNVLEGAGGADTIDGGAGMDTASYAASNTTVMLDLSDGTYTGGHAVGDTFISIENLLGSRYPDVLTGDASVNHLDGGPGNDRLEGRAGADTLVGGPGLDTASYAASTAAVTVNLLEGTATGGDAEGDSFTSIENLTGSGHDDSLTGDAGNNVLEGGAGGDILDGGEGIDTASYAGSASRVDVRLSGTVVNFGDATGDTLANIENLTGSVHNDTLVGNSEINALTGLAGNDLLWGSSGDDLLTGGPGADRLVGGAGNDTASWVTSSEAVTVRLHSLSATGGDAEGDTFPYTVDIAYTDADGVEQTETLPDVEHLTGSAFDDTLAGDRRDNDIGGLAGDDTLYGGPGGGDDVMTGGPGNDRLFGGQGADNLTGGPGDDSLAGGLDADIFVFGPGDGADTVTDFSGGTDKLDLTAFEIESVDEISMTTNDDGVTIDLSDFDGGSILLAGITTTPDAGDFIL